MHSFLLLWRWWWNVHVTRERSSASCTQLLRTWWSVVDVTISCWMWSLRWLRFWCSQRRFAAVCTSTSGSPTYVSNALLICKVFLFSAACALSVLRWFVILIRKSSCRKRTVASLRLRLRKVSSLFSCKLSWKKREKKTVEIYVVFYAKLPTWWIVNSARQGRHLFSP